ncbi:radical SAM protein [Candidatus Latescibacterota bacterium]
MTVPPLRLIALEVTRTCTLACRHCRGDSRYESYPDELCFEEIRAVLDNTASFAKPIIIITGGEPLTRPDIFDITAYSSSLGFRTVLATCGNFLTDETVPKLLQTGVLRISVSLDGSTSESHDEFRGVHGAFEAAIGGIEAAKRFGLDFQINSTITTLNIGELEALYNRAVELGAVAFHPFLLVPMGRGKGLADFALSGEAYESALKRISEIAAKSLIEIKPTCSPHYSRVMKQMRAASGEPERSELASSSPAHRTHGSGGKVFSMTRGCLGGQGFVFVSHIGKVQMCGFLEIEAGDLRSCGYDLKHIWENSEFFTEIRDMANYHGKCGICEYGTVCGGCRARAYYTTGDYLAEEPSCIYIPKRIRT